MKGAQPAFLTRELLTILSGRKVNKQLLTILDVWETEEPLDIDLKDKLRFLINDPSLDLERQDHFKALIQKIIYTVSGSHLKDIKSYDQSLWSLLNVLEKNAIYP